MAHTIVVAEYDPLWPLVFEGIRITLQRALAGVPVEAIEHVGSTSVPGLAAKPIVDIDVVVLDAHVGVAVEALVAIGYHDLGDLGVPQRRALAAPAGSPRHNLYVVVQGCLALRNHLGVRRVLRADVALRDEYAAVKLDLAGRLDDIDQYVEGKSPTLRRILHAAGFDQAELDEVERLNRA